MKLENLKYEDLYKLSIAYEDYEINGSGHMNGSNFITIFVKYVNINTTSSDIKKELRKRRINEIKILNYGKTI
jgi:hypothetical protein